MYILRLFVSVFSLYMYMYIHSGVTTQTAKLVSGHMLPTKVLKSNREWLGLAPPRSARGGMCVLAVTQYSVPDFWRTCLSYVNDA